MPEVWGYLVGNMSPVKKPGSKCTNGTKVGQFMPKHSMIVRLSSILGVPERDCLARAEPQDDGEALPAFVVEIVWTKVRQFGISSRF